MAAPEATVPGQWGDLAFPPPNSGRWDFNILGMAADGVNSKSYKIPNPYDGGQRSLCNKCHSKDEFDHPEDFTP